MKVKLREHNSTEPITDVLFHLYLITIWQDYLHIRLHLDDVISLVAQACPTLCDPIDCSTPGLPVHHQLRGLLKLMSTELVMSSNQLILCCHLLLLPSIFPSITVFSNESVPHIRWPKYWSFTSVSVLEGNIQDWFPLGRTGWISLQSKGRSRVFSNTTVQKHQFFGAQLSSQSNSHIHRWLLEKP